MSQSNYYYAKNHTVGDEEVQGAPPEIAHEELDDQAAGDGADGDPDQESHAHVVRNAALMLHQIVEVFGGGGGDGGGGEQEGEAGGGLPVEVSQQPGRDGDAAA